MPLRQRRRRVLTDDANTAEADAALPRKRSSEGGAKETYTAAARREQQPRLTDLVPLRPLTFALLLAAGAAFIGGFLGLYVWLPQVPGLFEARDLAPLDLTGRAGLAAWFSSLILILAAGTSLLVYSLRRHRVDDYRGRYRVWLWAALVAVLCSMNESTGIGSIGHIAVTPLAARCGLTASMVWYSICGLFGGVLALRLILETKRSRATLATLAAAATCLGVSAAVSSGWLVFAEMPTAVLITAGSHMTGCLLLAASVLVYARYVVLDAEGLLTVRPAKPKKEPKARRRAAKSDAAVMIDPPQAPKPHIAVRPATAPVAQPQRQAAASQRPVADDDEEDGDAAGDQNQAGLSRAERKRLRRENKKLSRQAGD